jgi:hypothetical protein
MPSEGSAQNWHSPRTSASYRYRSQGSQRKTGSSSTFSAPAFHSCRKKRCTNSVCVGSVSGRVNQSWCMAPSDSVFSIRSPNSFAVGYAVEPISAARRGT